MSWIPSARPLVDKVNEIGAAFEDLDPKTRKRLWEVYEAQVAWENIKRTVEAELVIPFLYTLARWRMWIGVRWGGRG